MPKEIESILLIVFPRCSFTTHLPRYSLSNLSPAKLDHAGVYLDHTTIEPKKMARIYLCMIFDVKDLNGWQSDWPTTFWNFPTCAINSSVFFQFKHLKLLRNPSSCAKIFIGVCKQYA